jgi:hypothetical protein
MYIATGHKKPLNGYVTVLAFGNYYKLVPINVLRYAIILGKRVRSNPHLAKKYLGYFSLNDYTRYPEEITLTGRYKKVDNAYYAEVNADFGWR